MAIFTHAHNQRERSIVIIGIITLVAIGIYFLVWEPLNKDHEQLKNIVAAQKKTLAWMQTAAAEIQQLNKSNIRSPQQLSQLIKQSFHQRGLKRYKQHLISLNKAQIKFKSVNFNSLMYCLAQLDQKYNIKVLSINIKALEDSNLVRVELVLIS